MDTETESCPSCGGPLKQRGSRTVCPRCLLAGTVEESASEISASEPPVRMDAPPAESLASAFPDLNIVRLIGAGGMGIVYEAEQKALERTVALKLLRLDSVNPEFAERFQREAKTLAKLDHPNIVRIIDQGESDGWVFILMEYVEGTDLSRLLERGKLEPESALEIADSLCAALDYAHGQGVVHRDIKPANILIDNDGTVKIADFGLAKLVEHEEQNFTLTSGGSSMGTPLYMAPEQRKSSADTDSRADIYSAGVVLYEMLTGELPLGRVRPPSEFVPGARGLDDTVLRALENEPAKRIASASELRRELRSAGSAGRRSRRWPLAIAALAIATGALMWAFRDQTGGQAAATSETDDEKAMVITGVSAETPVLLASPPLQEGNFGAIIEAQGDILVVGYGKVEPLKPRAAPPGEVYVYQIGADNSYSAPAILTASEPARGNQFGRYVALAPDASAIAVTAAGLGGQDGDGNPAGGSLTIFERDAPEENRWSRVATFYVSAPFSEGTFAMRPSAGPEMFALGSPHLDERGATRLYVKRDGRWIEEADIIGGETDKRSNFGVISAMNSKDRLVVAAPSAGQGVINEGKIVSFHRTGEDWTRAADITDDRSNTFALFGNELRISGDTLAVSSTGATVDGVLGAGSITFFEFDPENSGGWRRTGMLTAPIPERKRVGYGGRMDFNDDWLAAMTLQNTGSDNRHCVIYIAKHEKGAWRHVGAINGASDAEPWAGRVAIGDHFIACGHPYAEVDGVASAGRIYLFAKELFQQ